MMIETIKEFKSLYMRNISAITNCNFLLTLITGGGGLHTKRPNEHFKGSKLYLKDWIYASTPAEVKGGL